MRKNRIFEIVNMIPDGKGIIDVGTDHAYVPIELAKRGYTGNIIASDINEGPLDRARLNYIEAEIDKEIDFLLCDGLQLCDPDKIDTVVIAGMGGDLICDIIDKAEWTMNSHFLLILQPMTKCEILRYFLVNNGYGIISEKHIEDSGKQYTIITSRYLGFNTIYSDAEIFVGKNPTEKLVKNAISSFRKKPSNRFNVNIISELENFHL